MRRKFHTVPPEGRKAHQVTSALGARLKREPFAIILLDSMLHFCEHLGVKYGELQLRNWGVYLGYDILFAISNWEVQPHPGGTI